MTQDYKVLVDVEKTLYDNDTPFLKFLNDFTKVYHTGTEISRNEGYVTGEELKFEQGDIQGWGYEGVYETFADIRGWKDKKKEKFLEGDQDGWPGFHEAVDMIWTDELPYEIPLLEENLPEHFRKLENLENVSEVVIGTSRGNFFSEYDVESAVEERLEEDFNVHSNWIFFLKEKSGTADFYIDDNPEMDLRSNEFQLAIRTPYNDHLPEENLVDSFDEAVERINGETSR